MSTPAMVVLGIIIVIAIIILIVKLFSAAIRAAIILVLLSAVGLIAFGDGSEIVEKISPYLSDGDKVVKLYDDYKDNRDADPALNQEEIDKLFKDIKEKAGEAVPFVKEKAGLFLDSISPEGSESNTDSGNANISKGEGEGI